MSRRRLKSPYFASVAVFLAALVSGAANAATTVPLRGLSPLAKLTTKSDSGRFDIYNTPFLLDLAKATINFPPSREAYLHNSTYKNMPSIDLRMFLLRKAGPLRLPNGTIIQLTDDGGEGKLVIIVPGAEEKTSKDESDGKPRLTASFDTEKPAEKKVDDPVKISAAGGIKTTNAIKLLRTRKGNWPKKAFLLWTVTDGYDLVRKQSSSDLNQAGYSGSFVALKHGTRIRSIQNREMEIGSGKLLARNSDDRLTINTSSGRLILGRGASAILSSDGKSGMSVIPLISPRRGSIILETKSEPGKMMRTVLEPMKEAVITSGSLSYNSVDSKEILRTEKLLDKHNPGLKPAAKKALADLLSAIKKGR